MVRADIIYIVQNSRIREITTAEVDKQKMSGMRCHTHLKRLFYHKSIMVGLRNRFLSMLVPILSGTGLHIQL